jgi:lysine decarboxylase
MVTNGTSTSNKIMSCSPAGSTLLIDRNCHKSLAHLLMMSDVVRCGCRRRVTRWGFRRYPPPRIYQRALKARRQCQAQLARPCGDHQLHSPTAVLTPNWIKADAGRASIHFDSAWVPYTNFHPIYAGKAG